MSTQLKKQIREIIQVLNDEALFHARDIPGDQDVFEPKRQGMSRDAGMTKYGIFDAIEAMIDIYDHVDEAHLNDEAASIIAHIQDDIKQLRRCVGK